MKPRYFTLLYFIVSITLSDLTFAHVLELPPGTAKHKFYAPHKVIDMFFKAVDRGELIVFDKKIDKSMLIPIQVEYVYELNSAVPKIKVYSDFKKPFPVQGQRNCKIRGVSATLDEEGLIIETETHIWPE